MVLAKIFNNINGLECFFFDGLESSSVNAVNLLKGCFSCEQVHENRISVVRKKTFYKNSDGLFANKKSNLVIRTADCLPVLIYDKEKKGISAIHAGWRGLSKGIIKNFAALMEKMDIAPENLLVAIGPHIGVCCYEIDKSLIKKFSEFANFKKNFYETRQNRYFLNLGMIARHQFNLIGIPNKNIEDVNVCTKCENNFFSYRRNKTNSRNYSFLILK